MPSELLLPASIAAVVAAACWVASLVFEEYSWVDRVWSVAPPIYVGAIAARADWGDARLNLMTALTALWGMRLTFNYARKGGYAKGGEDYRWKVLKARMSGAHWHAFNLGFIAIYQNVLLLLIASPALTASRHRSPLGPLDAALAAIFLVLLAGETVADQQQWMFHREKESRAAAGRKEPKGFLDTGLWAWSRHPNFFCEQGQWWVVYLFGVAASGRILHPTIAGPILLTLLFHGSARFTESITATKYPLYADYRQRVSRMIPLPARREGRS